MDSLRKGAVAAEAAAGDALTGRRKSVRLRGALVCAGCLAVLIAGARIRPSASLSGTHCQLGLPACSFLARTGYPCPTCGLTTSVSAMAHGQVVLAWKAHPFGVVLSVALAAFAVVALLEVLTGREALSALRPGAWIAWVCVLGIPLGWGLKLLMGLADGTLPLR